MRNPCTFHPFIKEAIPFCIVTFQCLVKRFAFWCVSKILHRLWFKCTAARLVIWNSKAELHTDEYKRKLQHRGGMWNQISFPSDVFTRCTLHCQECGSWQFTLSKQSVSLFLFFPFSSIGFPFNFSLFSALFPPSVFTDGLFGWWWGAALCQWWAYGRGKEKKVTQA